MNPILPIHHHVPDVEARQWHDGRVYLYGSYDISGDTTYCSYEYRVFSSEDLIHWTDHGISFRSTGLDSDVNWSEQPLFAPDCIYRDGLYYLYFCTADNSEGVAVSSNPYGPFKNAVPVLGADGDAIDPAAFVNDDGEVYYYWGQFNARGARLMPDMSTLDPSTINVNLLNEAEHGFHEGSSLRKRNGIYYFVYTDISRGKATCLSYATSSSPLGPFTKGGVIIDNIGCDPDTWNNHGSIEEVNGSWYVFYHRSSQASNFSRRVCIEPIHFLEDGSIPEVEMTTQGVSGPLQATQVIEAYRACLLNGKVRAEILEPLQASEEPPSEFLSMIQHDDWAAYKYIDFGEGVASFHISAASLTYGGDIEIRLDQPNGPVIGVCAIEKTGGWQQWGHFSCDVSQVVGVHAIYLIFKGRSGRLFNIDRFYFEGNRD